MSKQLYEEALADVKKLKEVAEDNAKRALVEAVTPRIRDLIERELLREYNEMDGDAVGAPGSVPPHGDLMTDDYESLSGPEEGGKVTLDLDDLMADTGGSPVGPPMFGGDYAMDDMVYGLDTESVKMLLPVINSVSLNENFEEKLSQLEESIKNIKYSVYFLKESKDGASSVPKLISLVEDMYSHLQENLASSGKKKKYELTLESYYQQLNKLQEQNMRRNRSRRLFEDDSEGGGKKELSFLVKFGDQFPEEALDDVEIEVTPGGDMGGDDFGDDEDMGDEDMGDEEMGDDEDMGDMGDDEDMGDMGDEDMGDEGGDEEEPQEEGQYMESRVLRNNLVVEIDEGMLRREIGRMKTLREARARHQRRLNEARRLRSQRRNLRESAPVPSTKGHGPGKTVNSFGGAKSKGDPWLDQELTLEIDEMELENDEMETTQSQQMESYRRNSRLASRNGARHSDAPSRHAVQAESVLRAKLAESNLFNAKLIYANKLLQNESLSRRQKAQVIERLDEASNLREVKLVYESLTKALAGTSRPLSESADRKVIGSSSMATRPAATNLNEGFETDRWARLAGINK
jgi:hypothetical protein